MFPLVDSGSVAAPVVETAFFTSTCDSAAAWRATARCAASPMLEALVRSA
jgi:hypothetical protein